jgi:hypothetical protein
MNKCGVQKYPMYRYEYPLYGYFISIYRVISTPHLSLYAKKDMNSISVNYTRILNSNSLYMGKLSVYMQNNLYMIILIPIRNMCNPYKIKNIYSIWVTHIPYRYHYNHIFTFSETLAQVYSFLCPTYR